jgi:hypothetical protein
MGVFRVEQSIRPGSDDTAVPVRKKGYEKPRLDVYGDLTAITQSMMAGGMNDGSGHPNMHFTS